METDGRFCPWVRNAVEVKFGNTRGDSGIDLTN